MIYKHKKYLMEGMQKGSICFCIQYHLEPFLIQP